MQFPKILNKSVREKVDILVSRHENNYYSDWTQVQINELHIDLRPLCMPTIPSKTERRDNKMLAWAYRNCDEFRRLLEEGHFCSLNKARNHSTIIWKSSPDYNVKHATTIPNTGLKRRRGEDIALLLARHEFKNSLGLCRSRPMKKEQKILGPGDASLVGEEIRNQLMGERRDELEELYRTVTLEAFIDKIVGMIV